MQQEQKQEAYRVEVLLTGAMDTCFKQCVNPTMFSGPDLDTPEAMCLDRCSLKYFETNQLMKHALNRGQGKGGR